MSVLEGDENTEIGIQVGQLHLHHGGATFITDEGNTIILLQSATGILAEDRHTQTLLILSRDR